MESYLILYVENCGLNSARISLLTAASLFLGSDSDSAWIFPHNMIHFFACLTFLTVYLKWCFFFTANLDTALDER